jgi:hypothetical protein
MNPKFSYAFVIAISSCFSVNAYGHGTPLKIEPVNGRLFVNHVPETRFAPPIFAQSDEYDDFTEAGEFEGLGDLVVWDIPGLNILGLDPAGSLKIEVLARPVIGTDDRRTIWYWDSITQEVQPSPADFHLLASDGSSISLSQSQQVSPPALSLGSLVGEVGYHNHTLLLYGLDDDLAAPTGVYGFFARFNYQHNQTLSSDPFLILFNYFTDNDSLDEASLAIFEAGTLPGDFDLDDKVSGRDLLMWQRLYGSTTRTVADISLNGVVDAADLAIWQANYGTKFGSLSALRATQVPEPTAMLLCTTALLIGTARRR